MTLPLLLPAPIDAELPVRSPEDVKAQWPPNVRNPEDAPVRDALAEALAEAFYAYQGHASYAAAQSDATRATDQYLASSAAEVGIYPQVGESDEALRDRLFTTPAVVTPQAILAAVNGILALYTTGRAELCESILDAWYVFDGNLSNVCHSFVGDGTYDCTPLYIDRRYDVRPNRSPTGAVLFKDRAGRLFVLRVPDIGATASLAAYAQDAAGDFPEAVMYVGDGTSSTGWGASYVFTSGDAEEAVYAAIANVVDRLAGHGVRWDMLIDPKLA
jgi:hypothetical protein